LVNRDSTSADLRFAKSRYKSAALLFHHEETKFTKKNQIIYRERAFRIANITAKKPKKLSGKQSVPVLGNSNKPNTPAQKPMAENEEAPTSTTIMPKRSKHNFANRRRILNIP
jgi:hypothetical protein